MSKDNDYIVIKAFRDKTNGKIYDVGQLFSAAIKREKEIENLGYIKLNESNLEDGQGDSNESSETK